MHNWKTTIAGVLAVVAAIAGAGASWAKGIPVDWTSVGAAIMAGVGLVTAADAKKDENPKP